MRLTPQTTVPGQEGPNDRSTRFGMIRPRKGAYSGNAVPEYSPELKATLNQLSDPKVLREAYQACQDAQKTSEQRIAEMRRKRENNAILPNPVKVEQTSSPSNTSKEGFIKRLGSAFKRLFSS